MKQTLQRMRVLVVVGSFFLITLSALSAWGAGGESAEETMAVLINQERAKRSLQPVRLREELAEAARVHSRDMLARENLTHASLNGDTARERIDRTGYEWKSFGEIIGREHSGSTRDMVNIWLASPPHAAIMLSPDYTEFGIGAAHRRGRFVTWYWTVVFGSEQVRGKKGGR
jgi:uncharacterized protein YkwD